jgi:transporter family protein
VSYVVASILAGLFFLTTPSELSITWRSLGFTIVAGVATGVGSLLYYTGLKYGDTGRISTIVALYFVVSVLLGVLLLDEPFGLRKVAGIILAIVAVVLLTS